MLPRKVKYRRKKRFSFYQSPPLDGIALSADLNGGGAQRPLPVARNRRASRELPIARPAYWAGSGHVPRRGSTFWLVQQWWVAGPTSWRRVRFGGAGKPGCDGSGRVMASRAASVEAHARGRNAATVYAAGQSSSNCRVSSVRCSICRPSRIAASFCSIQS